MTIDKMKKLTPLSMLHNFSASSASNVFTIFMLSFCVALAMALWPAAAFAGKLEKINVQPTAEGVQVKLTASDRLKYKVKDYKSPPRIIIQLLDTEKGVPYEKFPVNQGLVTDMKLVQVTKENKPATFVNVHLSKMTQYDFDLGPDGRSFVLKVLSAEGGPSGTGPLPPAGREDWEPPSIWTPPGLKGAGDRETLLPEYPSEEDTSPFVEGPINIVDADASQVIQILTKTFEASIVLDKEILTDEESMKAAGTPTGITLSLSNITLQDSLDVIASANGWKWNKVGNIYVITHEMSDEYGYEMTKTARFADPAQQMDVLVLRPIYFDACQFAVYASTIIPIPSKYFYCDSKNNIAILRGVEKDLERARKLFEEIDTPETRDRPTAAETTRQYKEVQNFISRVIKLKYIRAEELYKKLGPILGTDGNPYLGNMRLVTSWAGQSPPEAYTDNTLSFDSSTNSLLFIGREKVYNRLVEIVGQLDQPYSATIVRMIPLKYVRVEDFQNDLRQKVQYNEAGAPAMDDYFNMPAPYGYSFFGRKSQIFYSVDTNSITFIGTEDDYDRLMQIVNTVDIESRELITESLHLEDIRVEDLKGKNYEDLIEPILQLQEYGYGRAKVSFSPPSNSVIITAQRQHMERIKKLIKEFDNDTDEMVTKQIPLKYISVFRAAQILKATLANYIAGESKEQTPGDRDGPPPDGGFFPILDEAETEDPDASKAYSAMFESYEYGGYQAEILKGFYDYNKFIIYTETSRNSLIVKGTKRLMKKVQEIIDMIDIPYPQVKVDVHVIELFKGNYKNIGLGYIYQGKHYMSGYNLVDPESDAGSLEKYVFNSGFFLYDTAKDMVARYANTLEALITKDIGRIVTKPSMIVPEFGPADFRFVDKYPYYEVETSLNTGSITRTVKWEDIGFRLLLVPHFTPDGYVVIKIVGLSMSAIKGYVTGTDISIPILSDRSVATEVKLHDGEPLVIGGITTSSVLETKEKVPVLGDLPLVGKMFRKREKIEQETEIVIVITPTILPVDCSETDKGPCEVTP